VKRVIRAKLKRVQKRRQHAAIVAGIRRPDGAIDLLLVGGTRRFVLAYQVAQRLLIDYQVEDLFDDAVGAIDGSS